ncbi:MAG: type II secretion system F family protein [Sedimentisphaerales bacterium]|nr:type II secretion system F family protein [Sedimentisphaerales bacterium]
MEEQVKYFKYTARDFTGKKKEDLIQASSSNEVVSYLRDQGFTPIVVTEISKGKKKKQKSSGRKKRIKSSDLSALCWQLTTMVEGGIPIIGAIETISEDIDNVQLKELLSQVSEKMNKGEALSEALSQFPKVFNKLSCAIVLSGETGGNLSEALRKLAEYFEGRDKFAKKVKGAMAYPAFVLVFIVLIVIFIMTFIIPRFTIIFEQLGDDLPAFTQSFMDVYHTIYDNALYIVGFIVILIIAGITMFKTTKGHYIFSRVFLSIPLFGKVISQAFMVVFCRTMSTLISSGVSVMDTFGILQTMTANDIIREAITTTKDRVVEGASVSSSLSSSGFFPNMVVKMVQVGEESGSMSKVLERTADYYERKVDSMISTLMSLLEPVMIVTVGGIVLIVTLALYLPIFSMGS